MHVISIVSGVPNNSLTTRITLQESLEEESRKDTPAFGEEDLEIIHRAGTEAGLLASTTSLAQYTQLTDQTTGGLWEPGFSC